MDTDPVGSLSLANTPLLVLFAWLWKRGGGEGVGGGRQGRRRGVVEGRGGGGGGREAKCQTYIINRILIAYGRPSSVIATMTRSFPNPYALVFTPSRHALRCWPITSVPKPNGDCNSSEECRSRQEFSPDTAWQET